MLVKEAMNSNPITTDPETSLKEAIRTMIDNHIGSIIVVKNGKMVGIFTERDVLNELAQCSRVDLEQTKVKDIMTRWVVSVKPEDTIEKAVKLMAENNIKKLPVVRNDKLVGIITASDIVVTEPMRAEELAGLISVKFKKN